MRVIARDPARLPEEVRAQVEAVRGSTDDPAVLRRALEGVESLFWCVPSESLQETNVRGHYERFARAASRAVREAGTPRVVTISTGGKGLARNAGRISGLHAMEDILNEPGAPGGVHPGEVMPEVALEQREHRALEHHAVEPALAVAA